ncbi:MAG: hypothetical protein INR69_08655, partial [Mucilaginibacter polytrichastri]|nr:hypothetical protein [Mucilaginibacter polytrichastri]
MVHTKMTDEKGCLRRSIRFVAGAFFTLVFFMPATGLTQAHLRTDGNGRYRLTTAGASHFARLALNCIGQQYPNKPSNMLESDADA